MNKTVPPNGTTELGYDDYGSSEDPYGISWDTVNWIWYVGQRVSLVNLSVGFAGNMLSLIAFIKQLSVSHAYYHQISIIACDLLVSICYSLAMLGDWYFHVWENIAPASINQSKFLLTILHLGYAFLNMFVTAGLLIMVGTSVDRLYALKKPIAYKNLKKKRWAMGLFCCSIVVGILTGLHSCFQMNAVYDEAEQKYMLVYDEEFNSSSFAITLDILRSVLRLVCAGAILCLAILISKAYRKLKKKQKQMAQKTDSQKADSVSEKTLAKLLLAQATLVIIGQIPLCAMFTMYYFFKVSIWSTLGLIMDISATTFLTAMTGYNFAIYMAISKQFRQALISALRCKPLNAVIPAATASGKSGGNTRSTVASKSRIQVQERANTGNKDDNVVEGVRAGGVVTVGHS